jgi:response regulator RpfG family c-di-GMP phosphodiesterase
MYDRVTSSGEPAGTVQRIRDREMTSSQYNLGDTTLADVTTTATALPRILCVDDDANVLEGLRRALRGTCTVVTAVGARAALAILEQDVDFAVVIADLRMPDLDGVVLLNQVRDGAPDIVRVLLTGYADAGAAMRAVNDGQVFRFLSKPCATPQLRATVTAAIAQHRLMASERVLLEQTLRGSVDMLTDVLSIAQPAAFGRAGRLKRYVSDTATALGVRDKWIIELAAQFSQLGCLSLSHELVEKIYHAEPLTAEEQQQANRLPEIAERLVAHIPRLEPVREILRHQHTRWDGENSPTPSIRGDAIPLGARLLSVALDFDRLEAQGMERALALDTLTGRTGWYDPTVLSAFTEVMGTRTGANVREMRLSEVTPGMIFVNDVFEDELLLVARGQEVTESLVGRVQHHWASFASSVMVRVILPAN